MSLTLKLVLTPVLVAQAVATRARLPRLPEAEGPREGEAGDAAATRQALRLLVAGDSSAAGVGVAHQRQALAPQLGERVAEHLGTRVSWWLHAQSGLTSAQTLALLQQAAPLAPAEIAVVVTGVNDLIDQVPSRRAVAHREALANWLRNAQGVHHVVFAPLPPVHHFPGLPQPLRWIAGSDARRHNEALRDWAAGRSDVSVPEMDAPLNPGTMARDGFHPGEPVYRYCASAIAEHIATAVWPTLPKETRR
ncbi:MAG: SGNH/GDSL hydrolase family protein [Rubrivivax sp.]|nr:SGNH/GDSL hydrolase family protein [Rubrivivax sp.]